MEFTMTGKCVIKMEHVEGDKQSKHIVTKFNLDVSNNLDKTQYLNADNLPTANGANTLTNVFIQGLIGNINYAHEKNYWDSAEHLRYIISELERGFIEVASTTPSTFQE